MTAQRQAGARREVSALGEIEAHTRDRLSKSIYAPGSSGQGKAQATDLNRTAGLFAMVLSASGTGIGGALSAEEGKAVLGVVQDIMSYAYPRGLTDKVIPMEGMAYGFDFDTRKPLQEFFKDTGMELARAVREAKAAGIPFARIMDVTRAAVEEVKGRVASRHASKAVEKRPFRYGHKEETMERAYSEDTDAIYFMETPDSLRTALGLPARLPRPR
jgi:hypothetical protein